MVSEIQTSESRGIPLCCDLIEGEEKAEEWGQNSAVRCLALPARISRFFNSHPRASPTAVARPVCDPELDGQYLVSFFCAQRLISSSLTCRTRKLKCTPIPAPTRGPLD